MSKIIDGKAVSTAIKEKIKTEVVELNKKGIFPCLSVIIVGDDSASHVYVNNKKKDCAETGIISKEFALSADTTTDELLDLINKLNNDDLVNGIICQLPVPKQIDENAVIEAISQKKDVDAFHASNVGKLMQGVNSFVPCTPAGIIDLLDYYNIPIEGKNCVVVGRSNIVGKPMTMLLIQRSGTVTTCHSRTKDLKEFTSKADILVVAIGKPKFITGDMVKEGAVVIDVGMDRDENDKLCGDVDFESVAPKASYITPVPGGVGPMTRAELLKNTMTAVKLQKNIK